MSVKIELPTKEANTGQHAVIKILGIGGGGCNAINRMIAANVGT